VNFASLHHRRQLLGKNVENLVMIIHETVKDSMDCGEITFFAHRMANRHRARTGDGTEITPTAEMVAGDA
jgi:hypothetical protein